MNDQSVFFPDNSTLFRRLLTQFLLSSRQLALITALLAPTTVQAQAVDSQKFTFQLFAKQIFSYEPIQREGVTAAKFMYAKRILQETKSAAHNNPDKLNVADFWNITSAFIALQESQANIELAFKKAVVLDAESVCSYVKAMGANGLDKCIPENFLLFYHDCLQTSTAHNSKPVTIGSPLDPQLIALVAQIHQQDVAFRGGQPVDWARQHPLDKRNQQLIDSLYQHYHTYLGTKLVGKSLEYVMWAVVQHSNISMMKQYLPVIQQAVQQQQLDTAPFKMLLDRIYTLDTGKQVFGSQVGVPLVDEQMQNEVEKQYLLK